MINVSNSVNHMDQETIFTINGKRTYALRQANIQRNIQELCQSKWVGLTEKLLTMDGRDAKIMV